MEYRIDDQQLNAAAFIDFANKVWPGKYDEDRTAAALSKTLNITAYDGETLVGCLRILTDGYFFGTITEMLVHPEYQRQGIGSRLMGEAHALAGGKRDIAVYLVANEKAIPFYEKLGMKKAEDVMQYNHIDWTPFTVQ